MKKQEGTKIGISIGANKESIAEARAAINDILESSCEQETKRVALDVLRGLCQVNNPSVSHCVVN